MVERGHPSPRPVDDAATAAPAFRLAEPCVVSTDSAPAPSRRRRAAGGSGGGGGGGGGPAERPPSCRSFVAAQATEPVRGRASRSSGLGVPTSARFAARPWYESSLAVGCHVAGWDAGCAIAVRRRSHGWRQRGCRPLHDQFRANAAYATGTSDCRIT